MISDPINNLPSLRDVIAQHQLSAKKALGQNFLLDLNLISKIVRQAGNLSDFDIVEIGPGIGGLTRSLLQQGARHVLAVERDERLRPVLNQISNAYPDRFSVIFGDALKVDMTQNLTPPIKIIANLPYNIGTELLVKWLSVKNWPPYWHSLTLMFQKEVAERIVARPNTKAYGRLSILANWRTNSKIVMHLPPQAFTPSPKVHSAVVHFECLMAPKFPADAKTLEYVVATAFNQRRKMMRVSCRSLLSDIENALHSVGIIPTQRAGEITLEQFCALARLVNLKKYKK